MKKYRQKFYLLIATAVIIQSNLYAQTANETLVRQMLQSLHGSMRLSIQQYTGVNKTGEQSFKQNAVQSNGENWQLQLQIAKVPGNAGAIDVAASFTLKKGVAMSTAVAVSFDFS